MELLGKSLIAGQSVGSGTETFSAFNPGTGSAIEPAFTTSTSGEVAQAAEAAREAFEAYRLVGHGARAAFLREIADRIDAIVDKQAERAPQETALPEGRIRMETARTTSQLRLFADLVAEGSWVGARIDRAQPDREPLPKPDVRSMLKPLGPVAVFGASNFPMAFSTAGGDTASALASGCPVIVKAHPAHPGTAELVGHAINEAIAACAMPAGTFSLLFDEGHRVGAELVQHPAIRAVGFTGSIPGGTALMKLAAARPEPIPVYAEMGSNNPMFLFADALAESAEPLAETIAGSVLLGVGQFCTSPGLIFVEEGVHAEAFVRKLAEQLDSASASPMLTDRVCSAYRVGVERLTTLAGVEALARSKAEEGWMGGPALFATELETFVSTPVLSEEVFGPATVVVRFQDREALLSAIKALPGQLTATVHAGKSELPALQNILGAIEDRTGRLLFGGVPTGVEVCHAMIHGGPFPATSDGRSTSVGTRAIERWCRYFAYQNFPDSQLPPELQESNPLEIDRLEN